MASSHRRPQYDEGPEAAQRFERTLSRVLTVTKTELDKREADYKKARPARKPRASRPR